jgi:hypothetical protein
VAHYDRSSHHPKGLVKQAYSAKVLLSPTAKARKWHLTAYFSYEDLEHIPTIDQDPVLHRVTVPPGVFRSGKNRSKNSGVERGATRSHSPDTETSSLSSLSPKPDREMPNAPTGLPEDRRLVLPPLRSTLANVHPYQNVHGTRSTEDQRIIRLLNSRHVS